MLFWFGIIPALFWQFALALGYLVWVPTGQTQLAYGAAKLWLVIWPLLWWRSLRSAVRKVRPQRGLSLRHGLMFSAVIIFSLGIFWWLAQASLSDLRPAISAEVLAFGLNSTTYIFFALVLSVIHSAFEEWYWRSFVFRGLRTKLYWQWAAMISSMAFAAHHAIVLHQFAPVWLTILGTSTIVLVGYLWCYLYQRTGSLLGSWVSHMVADLAVMAIGYWIIFV